jgi:integrase
MSSFFSLLQRVHEKVHDSAMKLNYSEPKIFTGGVDVNAWSKLSAKDKKDALSKKWYIYYSFRNPITGKLKRQTNIKGGANLYKDKKSRYYILLKLKESLQYVLSEGFNPYEENTSLAAFIEQLLLSDTQKSTKPKLLIEKPIIKVKIEDDEPIYSIKDAFSLALLTKFKVQNPNSHRKFKSRINQFERWLLDQAIDSEKDISLITKRLVIQYLNAVLQKTSPRNRNNTRTDIGSLFQTLVDNEVIQSNFVREINVLKAIPERNKTYTSSEQKEIFNYLKQHDTILSLFVQFVSYNYLRPIEVCRLKVGDIDLKDKKIYVKAKNKPVKIKIIPQILLDALPDISELDAKSFLFGRHGIGETWLAEETNKRNEFSKRFKVIKDHFELGAEFGMYSFRHTFITKLYRKLRAQMSQHEAKSHLMPITGHATMLALEKYLRDVDAELPEDYSSLLI